MSKHSHRFVETYTGMGAYGLDRKSDEETVQLYLQKLSDDDLMKAILGRMSDEDLRDLYEMAAKILKKYLSENEYHRLFLKEDDA